MTNLMSIEVLLIAARGVALLVALCVFAWAFVRWRSAAQRDTQRLFEQMDMLTGEMNSLAITVRATSERLEELHNRIESQSRLTANVPGPSQRGYEFATRLAKNGASAEDLIASCGISRHEAELLIRLNGATTTPAPSQEAIAPAKNTTLESLGARIEQAKKTTTAAPEPITNKALEPAPRRARFAAVG